MNLNDLIYELKQLDVSPTICEEAIYWLEHLYSENERLYHEREVANLRSDKAIQLLSSIYALLYPPPIITEDGCKWVFKPEDAQVVLERMMDRIRALPGELEQLNPQQENPRD